MTTLQLVILLLSILALIIIIVVILYIYEFRRVQKIISTQLVRASALKEIQKLTI